MVRLYTFVTRKAHEIVAVLFPKYYAGYMYKKIVKRKLNLDDPKDYNEKIEWLKIHADLSKWTECADKYRTQYFGLGIVKTGLCPDHILKRQLFSALEIPPDAHCPVWRSP